MSKLLQCFAAIAVAAVIFTNNVSFGASLKKGKVDVQQVAVVRTVSLEQPAFYAPAPYPLYAESTPNISYKHHRTLRKTGSGGGDITMILDVKNPTCCTIVQIPVCVPCCCTDVPKVSAHCGLFGRGIAVYEWCCGYKVKVVFDKCGDVVVHSYGR
jgi:hypothetical protein